jgi:hypothetical protein
MGCLLDGDDTKLSGNADLGCATLPLIDIFEEAAMAEALGATLVGLLRLIFARQSDQLSNTILPDLRRLELPATVTFSAQATSSGRDEQSETAAVATVIAVEDLDDDWRATLRAKVDGAATTVTAVHRLGCRIAWQSSASVKTETSALSPELSDAAAADDELTRKRRRGLGSCEGRRSATALQRAHHPTASST